MERVQAGIHGVQVAVNVPTEELELLPCQRLELLLITHETLLVLHLLPQTRLLLLRNPQVYLFPPHLLQRALRPNHNWRQFRTWIQTWKHG